MTIATIVQMSSYENNFMEYIGLKYESCGYMKWETIWYLPFYQELLPLK